MNTTSNYFSFNDSNWAQMLDMCNKNHNHIFYDSNKEQFYISKANVYSTDKTIKELNLHEIVDLTKKVNIKELDSVNINKIAISLDEMANKAEKKHFSGIKKILKLFNIIYNGFSGKGFHTTISKAREVANQLRSVTGKSEDAVASATDQDLHSIHQPHEPIIYTKGEKKTKDVIPAKKEILGKGVSGAVHEHRNKPSLVIKKTTADGIEKEYKLGNKLHHPNLVKIHDLYIKKYPRGNKYKLVLDKINGKTLHYYFRSPTEKISDETVRKLLSQAQNCCLYLFSQHVSWGDVNDGNIFITEDKNDLMLIDFEHWRDIEDPQERAKQLLLGSMEIVGWIIKSSSLRARSKINPALEQQIIFPKKFFGEQNMPSQVMSILPFYSSQEWMQSIKAKLATMTEEEMKEFLKDYFKEVEIAFSNK